MLSDAVSRIFNRGIQMRKVRFAAALVLIGTAWIIAAAANQRVATSTPPQIDPKGVVEILRSAANPLR